VPRLADVAPPALPVTAEPWTVPAGSLSSVPDAVPPSAEEAAASAAYGARKRRHADMARGGPAETVAYPGAAAGPATFPASGLPGGKRGPRAPEEDEWAANAGGRDGSAAGHRGSAA